MSVSLQEVRDAVRDAASVEGEKLRLSCEDALALADRLGVPPGLVGEACNAEGIRIRRCQLGCFP